MKINIPALCVSMIAVVFSWLVPATYAVAKNCKPSAELVNSYMELQKEGISRGWNGVAQSQAEIVAEKKSFNRPTDNEYNEINTLTRLLPNETVPNMILNYKLRIASSKLNVEASLCNNNLPPDPSLYYAGNVPQNNSNQDQPTAENNSNQASNDSPPTKKLTAAERKKQQAQQKAEEISTKSQQLAQETQSKADAARQGKRKKHDPAAEAHHCIKVNEGGLFGSMDNKCNFKIWYVDCGYRPTEKSWLKSMACENQKFGLSTVGPNKRDPSHTRHVEKMYWFACKDPARPVDYKFIEGSGIHGRCFDTANSVFD